MPAPADHTAGDSGLSDRCCSGPRRDGRGLQSQTSEAESGSGHQDAALRRVGGVGRINLPVARGTGGGGIGACQYRPGPRCWRSRWTSLFHDGIHRGWKSGAETEWCTATCSRGRVDDGVAGQSRAGSASGRPGSSRSQAVQYSAYIRRHAEDH